MKSRLLAIIIIIVAIFFIYKLCMNNDSDKNYIKIAIAPFQAGCMEVLTTENPLLSDCYSELHDKHLECIFLTKSSNNALRKDAFVLAFWAVVITNISDKPQKLYPYNLSWFGYYALSFEIEKDGKIHKIEKIKPHNFGRNRKTDFFKKIKETKEIILEDLPDMVTLHPNESIIINPNLGYYNWQKEHKELMFYNGTQIRACYELYPRLPTEKKETVYSEWIELKRILPHPIKTYFDGKLVY